MDIKTTNQVNKQRNSETAARKVNKRGRRPLIALLIVLIVAAIVILGSLFWQTKGSAVVGDREIEKDKFQAVFLTNGQVYFGKASGLNSNYVNMKNIYYLQVQQSVQPSTDKPEQSSTDANSQVSLTKLGKELHGPTDEMHIAKDQVLFWENLRDDSTVAKAIKDYESK